MKKLLIGFIAGLLFSMACFVPLLLLKNAKSKGLQASLVSDHVASGSRDALHWNFSKEMIPTKDPVDFSPMVKGTFSWTHPTELTFVPEKGWRGCTTFTATLSDELRSTDGHALRKPHLFAFRSDPLTVKRIEQSNYDSNNRIRLDLAFSERVHPTQLKKHLQILLPSGNLVHYDLHAYRSKKSFGITFYHPVTNQVLVKVTAGLQSENGNLALEKTVEKKITFTRDLKLLRLSTDLESFGSGAISARFNLPLDLTSAADLITVEPKVKITLESRSYYLQHICRILGEFKPDTRYRITFDAALKSKLGTTLGKTVSQQLYFPDARSELKFTTPGTYMSTEGGLSVPFKIINTKKCKVVVRRIYSNNLVQMAQCRSYYYGNYDKNLSQMVAEKEMSFDDPPNVPVEHTLDLRSLLKGKTGLFNITLSSKKAYSVSHYVVVSDIGISLKKSKKDFLVWVNSIHTLAPIAGAKVKLYSTKNQVLVHGTTDKSGVVHLAFPDKKMDGEPYLVSVEKGDELSFLELGSARVSLPNSVGSRPYLTEGYEAYLFTDRGIYRPGETTHLKVIVRNSKVTAPESFPLTLKVYQPNGKLALTQSALLSKYGTAEFTLPWPDYAATGRYRIETFVPGKKRAIGETVVAIEEFVPPQIRVRLESKKERVVAGKNFGFTLFGEHLFGGLAKNLATRGQVNFFARTFTPSQWKSFEFGDERRTFTPIQKALAHKNLNAKGWSKFWVATSAQWRPSGVIEAVFSGTAIEDSGRSVTAYGSRIIDVYPYHIGVKHLKKSLRVFVPHTFEVVTVRPDGSLETSVEKLHVRVEKMLWASTLVQRGESYEYQSVRKATLMKEFDVNVKAGRAKATFKAIASGEYRLVLSDSSGTISSTFDFYVTSSNQSWGDQKMASPDKVELLLDKKKYEIGETAMLTIKAPFAGKLLFTMENNHILSHQILTLTNNTAEIKLPVKAEYSPNAYCSVSIIRPALPEEIWGQHRAAGRVPLLIKHPKRKLNVELELPKKIRPKTKLTLPVRVTDSDGKGCKAEVVVAAVDEGICMLTDFKSPNPFAFFFAPRRSPITLYDLYARLMPETLKKINGTSSAPGGGMVAAIRKRLNPIKARRFKPVALWSGTVETDTNGVAKMVFDVPEFTGELRIMAVAIDRSRLGCADQPLVVKRPLIVQSSLPRFLAPSDQFVLPITLHNESKTNGEVVVSGSFAKQTFEQTVFLNAGTSTNLSFKLTAPTTLGKKFFHLKTKMGKEHFEEQVEIAVRPTTSRVSLFGSDILAAGETKTLDIPFAWLKGTGEASIQLSAMPAVQLSGSLDYLLHYPYGCLEQTVSKSMPLLYLADLASQTQQEWVSKDATAEFVNAGIYRVLSIQKNNGSFGLWPNSETYVWGSIYATHFLVEASKAYDVPKERLSDALDYLENRLHKMKHYNKTYACHVLALAKRPQHGTVARLLAKRKKLDRGELVNLAGALLATGKRKEAIALLVEIGVNPAQPVKRERGGSLRSSIRETAMLLSVLLDIDPHHKWVPVLVQRLNATRWRSTQENAIALMALGKYCSYFAQKQNFISGRMNDTSFEHKKHLQRTLKDGKVVLHNSGKDMLHYFWKSEGVPLSGTIKPIDCGLMARRRLLHLDGSPASTKELHQGDLYLVEIMLRPADQLDNVVVEDLLPAGLEIENGSLKTAAKIKKLPDTLKLNVLHTDIRDDRMLLFTGVFYNHQNYFYYAVRAVTVGEFVWPAISAGCMYDPTIQSIHKKQNIRVIKK